MNIQIQKLHSFTGHNGSVYALAEGFAPGILLSGSSDKFVAGWNLPEQISEKFAAQFPAPVYSLLSMKNRKLLLAGTGSGSIHILDIEAKQELKILQLHSAQVFDLAFSEKHQLLIAAGGDGQISFCDAEFNFIKSGKLSEQKIRNLAISPEEDLLAVACGDGTIRIFNLPECKEINSFHAHDLSANAIAWDPQGKYLLSGGRDAHLKAWDVKNDFALLNSIPAHNFAIYKIVFSPDGKLFATASRDKTVKIWDASNLEFRYRINKENCDGHINSVNTILWNAYGLVSAGDDRSVMLWRIDE